MPTGYTVDLYEGKHNVTLEEFTLKCARAFMVNMRDRPESDPIPDELENSSVADENLRKAKADVIKYESMTEVEANVIFKKQKSDKEKQNKKLIKDQQAIYLRYSEMLAKIARWEEPKELEHLKEYMCNQIIESVDYDCSLLFRKPGRESEQTAKGWLVMMRRISKENVIHYTDEVKRELLIAEDYRKFVKVLKDNVSGLQ